MVSRRIVRAGYGLTWILGCADHRRARGGVFRAFRKRPLLLPVSPDSGGPAVSERVVYGTRRQPIALGIFIDLDICRWRFAVAAAECAEENYRGPVLGRLSGDVVDKNLSHRAGKVARSTDWLKFFLFMMNPKLNSLRIAGA